jgi:hypothetical protein
MKSPFSWDRYSDQPGLLRDREYKKKMRRSQLFAYIKMLLTSMLFFPISMFVMPFLRPQAVDKSEFYGMGVNLDKGDIQFSLLQELGVKHVIMRLPLWDMDRIQEYKAFASKLNQLNLQILFNVLQDREHIDDKILLRQDLEEIFTIFSEFSDEFQIGNAINRSKWGFFSADEYLAFYRVAQELRETSFSEVKLIGPAVIDFEYHYTLRALFNNTPAKFDRVSSLLYVDRRGSPSNRQMGIFDLRRKIELLYAMLLLSPKAIQKTIYLTEANWPLENTAPYAPTSETECVTTDEYAMYMRQYYDIALKTGLVSRVYWHQLVAPGYGLVDDREGQLKKYPAFEIYKEMLGDIAK